MSDAWDSVLHGKAGQEKLAKVRAVLFDRFPDASDAVLWLQTRYLLETAETARNMATRRADDVEAMRKLAGALKLAQSALDDLSQPTREAFLHRAYMEGMRLSFGDAAAVAAGVASGVPETPFSSRENVGAIFVVAAARQVWLTNTGKDVPAWLNDFAPFAAFLSDLFKVLPVGAKNPRSAFQAWQKYRESGLF